MRLIHHTLEGYLSAYPDIFSRPLTVGPCTKCVLEHRYPLPLPPPTPSLFIILLRPPRFTACTAIPVLALLYLSRLRLLLSTCEWGVTSCSRALFSPHHLTSLGSHLLHLYGKGIADPPQASPYYDIILQMKL